MEAEERPAKFRKVDCNERGSEASGLLSDADKVCHANDVKADGFQQDNDPQNDVDVEATNDHFSSREEHNQSDKGESGDSGNSPPPEARGTIVGYEVEAAETPPMSKSKQKKLRKQQEWEAKRGQRKAMRKVKLQAKRAAKREARMRVAQSDDSPVASTPLSKGPKQPRHVQLPVTILIDCDFDDLMSDKERISLAAQITRSYSDNSKSPYRAHLAICSFGGKLRRRFDEILTHYKSWHGVRILDCNFVEAANKAKEWMSVENNCELAGQFAHYSDLDEDHKAELKLLGDIIYLTSEADETLTELKPYSTYIIGGLVDKNREKGICYKRATKCGVRTAKLPIREFMEMQSRQVLATNHVNEIMLKWLECGKWGEAFTKVIPKRKGGTLKAAKDVSATQSNGAAGQDQEEDSDKHYPEGQTEDAGAEQSNADDIVDAQPETQPGLA